LDSINFLAKSPLLQNLCPHFLFGLVVGLSFSKFFWILAFYVTLMLSLLIKLWISQDGVSIVAIRVIVLAADLSNETRLIITSLGTNAIEAIIATGPHADNVSLSPNVKFISLAAKGTSPFDFK